MDLILTPDQGFHLNDARPRDGERRDLTALPPPPTLRGALVTAAGRATPTHAWDSGAAWRELKELVTLGASLMLARKPSSGPWKPEHRLWPVAANAVCILPDKEEKQKAMKEGKLRIRSDGCPEDERLLFRSYPRPMMDGISFTGPSGHGRLDLWYPKPPALEGKAQRLPAFWDFATLQDWLLNSELDAIHPPPLGYKTLSATRAHVSLESATRTAADGQLFSDSVTQLLLERQRPKGAPEDDKDLYEWSLALHAEGLPAKGVERLTLGGSRLTARLEPAAKELWAIPPALEAALGKPLPGLMLMAVTPIYCGEGGWLLPGFTPDDDGRLLGEIAQQRVQLQAQISERPVSYSGWDMVKGEHKPTRRCLPAGSLLYLRPAERGALFPAGFGSDLWLKAIGCDTDDGLGRIIAAPWDPAYIPSHQDTEGA